MSDAPSSSLARPARSWRHDAAAIVESLFPVTDRAVWDSLLDLRQQLLLGRDWERTLDLFLACRQRCEEQQYLPFYRLRRLISSSLRLETLRNGAVMDGLQLEELLRKKHRSLEDLRCRLRRDFFELGLIDSAEAGLDFRLVEC